MAVLRCQLIFVLFMLNSKFKKIIVLSGLAVTSLVACYFLYPKIIVPLRPKEKIAVASIAVLPFVNMSNDPNQDYLSDGLTDGILNSLAHIEGLKVSARNSSFRFKGLNVDIKEVGKKLDVGTVLEGSVQIDGDRIRITAQLINVEDEFHFWSEQYDEKMDNVFAIQDKIATAIAEKLELTLLAREYDKNIKKPKVTKAFDLYLKGRAHWNVRTPSDLKKGIELFEQAIAIDSSYAAAYSGLADCYNALGYGSHLSPKQTFRKAKVAAMKAWQLDSTLAEPHASLGFFNFYYGWDWEAAEQEFRTSIALNPNYALAYNWYAYYLTAMQRYDEAIAILKKAIELDPLSEPIHSDIGFSIYYSGNYEQAVEKLQACVRTNPRFGPAHLWLGRSYQEQGNYVQAIYEYKAALDLNNDWPVALAALGHVYGVSGDKKNAHHILNTLRRLSAKKFVTAYGMALVYAGLDEKEQAFNWLNKAYEERSNWLVWLKTDPRFNSLRSEGKFAEMVNKVGLPQ
jgi:adenylate cyclase